MLSSDYEAVVGSRHFRLAMMLPGARDAKIVYAFWLFEDAESPGGPASSHSAQAATMAGACQHQPIARQSREFHHAEILSFLAEDGWDYCATRPTAAAQYIAGAGSSFGASRTLRPCATPRIGCHGRIIQPSDGPQVSQLAPDDFSQESHRMLAST